MSLPKKFTVAVVGATGTQGGATVHALIANGHHVRALTRDINSSAAKKLHALGATVVAADLTDAASLQIALNGVDTVFGMTTPFNTSIENEIVQGKTLIDAAKAAGVNHFVFTSAAQANQHTGIPHFESKLQIEEYLKASSMTWTIIGPAAFMDDFNESWYKQSLDHGKLSIVMPADMPLQFICSQDIGAFAALVISYPDRFSGKRIDIAGDEIAPSALAAEFTDATGKPITVESIPLTVAEGYSHDLAAMFRYFQETGLHINIRALKKAYPEVKWHTFANWIREEFHA
jgi:uncharacterized protein YbjT (DUF2867 family)